MEQLSYWHSENSEEGNSDIEVKYAPHRTHQNCSMDYATTTKIVSVRAATHFSFGLLKKQPEFVTEDIN